MEPHGQPAARNLQKDIPLASQAARQSDAIRSEDLFRGQTEVRVLHRGDEYRLRITRQGKLILTK